MSKNGLYLYSICPEGINVQLITKRWFRMIRRYHKIKVKIPLPFQVSIGATPEEARTRLVQDVLWELRFPSRKEFIDILLSKISNHTGYPKRDIIFCDIDITTADAPYILSDLISRGSIEQIEWNHVTEEYLDGMSNSTRMDVEHLADNVLKEYHMYESFFPLAFFQQLVNQ